VAPAPRAAQEIHVDKLPDRSPERRVLTDFQSALSSIRGAYQDLRQKSDQNNPLFQNIFHVASDGILVVDMDNDTIVEANPYACAIHGFIYEEFIGLPISTIIHPDYVPLYESTKETVIRGDFYRTTSTHLHKDGTPLYFDVGVTAIEYQDHNYLIVYMHDLREIKERIKAEQNKQKKVETQIYEQTTLLEISQTLSSTLDLDPDLILEQLRKIISYTHATLFAIKDTSLVALSVCGLQALEDRPPIEINLGGSGSPRIFFNGHQTTRIANIWNNDPEAVYLRSLFINKAAVLLEGIQSWMWVPLIAKGRVMGGLGIAHEQGGYFSVHHSDLAQTVANQAAITMVNAELYEHAQMYATLQERQRLARNLHDAVNQSLFSANLIAEVLPKLWEKDPVEGRKSLDSLRRLTNGAMAEMRMMMAELRPLSLLDDDLGNLLHLLSDAFSGRSNIPVNFEVVGKTHLPTEVQMGVYRLCQEGLNNIAKHSKATQVDISLHCQGSSIRLLLRDNGCGFDPSVIAPGHYGIKIMQERAEAVGAELAIHSVPGQGCELEINWADDPGRKIT
jgi:PAS domain S-box-containing protein